MKLDKASVVSGGLTFLGLLAGPSTCGLSLVLTTAGTAGGVFTGIWGLANDINHSVIVKQNWEKTLASIETHIGTCEAMVGLLQQLQEISGFQFDIKYVSILKSVKSVISVGKNMCQLIKELKALRSHFLSKTPQKMAKFSKRVAANGFFTIGGIVWDTFSVFSGQDELSNLNNGNLCTDAKKLLDLKANLQEEGENVKKLVKDITSFLQ